MAEYRASTPNSAMALVSTVMRLDARAASTGFAPNLTSVASFRSFAPVAGSSKTRKSTVIADSPMPPVMSSLSREPGKMTASAAWLLT
eukprot:13403815-Alexandrium_andersonii.AAC.1